MHPLHPRPAHLARALLALALLVPAVARAGVDCGALPDDTPCPDSSFCNGIETCQGGVCTEGTSPCTDLVACTVDTCVEATDTCSNTPQDVACNDGLSCNGVETCEALLGCQAGKPIDCSDGVECTNDICNEGTDLCDHVVDDSNCDNDQFCDGIETCHATLDCQDGVAPCNDAVDCTADSCNEALDTCTNAPVDLACNDGDFCNGIETCNDVFGCVSGDDPCDDGIDCTTDACIEGTDTCLPIANNAACSDGAFCNGSEVCTTGVGCEAGTPETCGDGVTCTTDSCNEGTDSCDHATVDALCDDGLFCTGEESCTVLGCAVGPVPECGDEIGCTEDSCNEDTDSCDNDPDDLACTDQLFCNGEELCDAGTGCIDGTPPCNDGILCTVDACEEVTDTCSNPTSDALCNDGLFCTGSETCDPLLGCVQGQPVDCSDGVDCTVDTCIDLSSSCSNVPDDSVCDDGDVCTGEEMCDASSGCQDGDDLACGDGIFCNGEEACDATSGCMDADDPCDDSVGCTIDTCDEKTDSCGSNTPDDSVCDDQLFCNGEEFCDASSGCLDGDGPCDDEIGCTTDGCIELADLCTNVPDDGACDDDDECTVDTCSIVEDCVNAPLTDFDQDGSCDVADNCPLEANPDQLDSDCTQEDFEGCDDIEFDPNTDPARGCCDGGDVCDPCPARKVFEDGSEACNPQRSGGINCTPGAGCELVTEDGCITVNVPAGALATERSISVTDAIDDEQNLLARDSLLYQVSLRPEGIDFAQPVAVELCWDDRDDDDFADEGVCGAGPGLGQTCDDDEDCGVGGECSRPSTTKEDNLVMKRNAEPFGKDGIFEPPFTCEAHDDADSATNDCGTAVPDCQSKDSDDRTVAGCCDKQGNTWELATCGFSEHMLGEFAGDLVPGKGSRQTDCVAEWEILNPHNEPYRDDVGMVSLHQTCRDGDPLCDHDGDADGRCTFHVGVCFNVLDRRQTDANDNRLCTPTDVVEWKLDVSGEGDDAGELVAQVAALGGGTVDANSVTFAEALDDRQACTRLVAIEAPLGEVDTLAHGGSAAGNGSAVAATTILRMAAADSDATDEPDIGAGSTTTTTMLEDGPKCGDADESGQVLATDALITLRTAVGSSSCDPVFCDVNVDGRITATDALAILKTAVGTPGHETACGLGALPSDRDKLRLTCQPAAAIIVD